jgi:starvation-inducible DNA-binding protein
MSTKNSIGLESSSVQLIVDELGDLLANRQVHYANLKGLHWDIQGDKFIELHELYEDHYKNESLTIDEIAERIVKLGKHPDNRYSEYIKCSDVKESFNISDWKEGVSSAIVSLKTILGKYRKLFITASEARDAGTVLLVMKHVSDIETYLWKLTVYIK